MTTSWRTLLLLSLLCLAAAVLFLTADDRRSGSFYDDEAVDIDDGPRSDHETFTTTTSATMRRLERHTKYSKASKRRNKVHGRYIVLLDPDDFGLDGSVDGGRALRTQTEIDDEKLKIRRFLSDAIGPTGGKVERVYAAGPSLRGATVSDLAPEALRRLLNSNRVVAMEEVCTLYLCKQLVVLCFPLLPLSLSVGAHSRFSLPYFAPPGRDNSGRRSSPSNRSTRI